MNFTTRTHGSRTAPGPAFRLTLLASSLLVLAACSSSDDTPTDSAPTELASTPADDAVAVRAADMMAAASGNLVDTALAADDFTILAAALEAAGLLDILGDPDARFTVFAPTDAAFEALGQDTIDALLADPDTLRDILLYHVVGGVVPAEAALALAGSTTETANGDEIAISLQGEQLRINMSNVTATDIFATNGVIHVIDSVLMPPADTSEDGISPGSVLEVANALGFNTLLTALQATALDATLANLDETFTVFAPTDAAFAALGEETVNALLADPETLTDILLYHVIAGEAVDGTTFLSRAGEQVAVANQDAVTLSLRENELFINDSRVSVTDVQADNGVIHVIDAVLLPPTEQTGGEVESVDGPIADPNAPTLLEVARSAGSFTTLVAALEATGLDQAIGHPDDDYTVFAPTDDAFAALGQDTIDALLADPDTLRDILLYHVIPGTVVDAAAALSLVGVSIEAGNGDRFELSLRDSTLFVNDSQLIATDIAGVNGVIHVIDAVLTPPAP